MANLASGDRIALHLAALMFPVIVEPLLAGGWGPDRWRFTGGVSVVIACSVISLTTRKAWLSADRHGGEPWLMAAALAVVLGLSFLVARGTISTLDAVGALVVVLSLWLTATTLMRQSVGHPLSWGEVGIGMALITIGVMVGGVAARVVTLKISLPTFILGLGCFALALALVVGGIAITRAASRVQAKAFTAAGAAFVLCSSGLWSSGIVEAPLAVMVLGFGAALTTWGIGELTDGDVLRAAATASVALVLAVGAVVAMGVHMALGVATALFALSAVGATLARGFRRRGFTRRGESSLAAAGAIAAIACCVSGLDHLGQEQPVPAALCFLAGVATGALGLTSSEGRPRFLTAWTRLLALSTRRGPAGHA